MKKFLSILLTFAMLFSLAMPAMAAEGDSATVYFQNNWQWTEVCAYIHYTDSTENAAYPGVAMTIYENDGTYDVYSVTFPVSNIDYIIFSGIKDDGSGARDATPQIPASDLYRNATYYCAWNDGNTYGREGGEGESLDSAAAPSGPSITGNATGDVTASYTPNPEAKWGTSEDDLTGSGTLAEAITAATATDSTVGYIQLQTGVTIDAGYEIRSGVFTLDLNGNTLTSNYYNYALAVRNSAEVTLTDTATGGAVISKGNYAVYVVAGNVVINGGSYTSSGNYVVSADTGSSLTIAGGTFTGGQWTSVAASGTTTITGGTFDAGTLGQIAYWSGTMDLSEYDEEDLNGLTIYSGADLTVSDENIKLPEGYAFKDSEGNTVTTLASGTVYTIGAESSDPTYTITAEFLGEGTITVPNTAAAGETVTVTLNPTEGYTGLNFRVFHADGSTRCEFTKVDELTYTFVMPAANVVVIVEFCLPGTTLDTIYYKGPWTNVEFEFTTSSGLLLDVFVGTIVESGIYAVSDIPEWSYGLTIRNVDNKDEHIDCGDIPTDGRNMYNAETGEWETYTPSQTPEQTTSAEIVWGSMSFTYTDEAGAWANDGSEGAGTVTVKNTGDTTIMASASYVPAGDFGITGSLDAAKTLASSESGTFTLTLSGKPNKALNNEKIGTVTIEITEVAPTTVTTAAELVSALAAGGSIKLGGEITLEERVQIKKPVTLDLNTHTLTLQTNGYIIVWQSDLSVRNGTILSGTRAVIECQFGSTLTVDNCTLSSPDYFALYLYDTTAVVTNSTLIGGVAVDSAHSTSTLTAVDRVTMTSIEGAGASGLSVDTGCTATVGFDPTDILTEYYNQGTVTNNGDGTWTVQ